MTTPWFDPNLFGWIPGTALGVIGGTWGSLCGALVPRGKARGLVVGSAGLLLIVSVGLLAAAIVGLTQGQPYGVWYALGLPGVLGTILFGVFFPMSRRMYIMAEQRRVEAQDAALG